MTLEEQTALSWRHLGRVVVALDTGNFSIFTEEGPVILARESIWIALMKLQDADILKRRKEYEDRAFFETLSRNKRAAPKTFSDDDIFS